MLIHFTDERPDLRVGEFAHAVSENLLVLGKDRERRGMLESLLRHSRNVIIGVLPVLSGWALARGV